VVTELFGELQNMKLQKLQIDRFITNVCNVLTVYRVFLDGPFANGYFYESLVINVVFFIDDFSQRSTFTTLLELGKISSGYGVFIEPSLMLTGDIADGDLFALEVVKYGK
jgi:hypothetical protein